MMEYRNENEIVMHSLGRSGSHAIVNWIASMFKEPIYFFNNCWTEDPYRAPIPYLRRVRKRPLEKFFVPLPKLKHSSEDEISEYRNIHKHCLMYSYEHRDIRKLKDGEFVQDRTLIGESRNRYNVLILRDFFNWLASCLLPSAKPRSTILDNAVGLWKVYAGEFLGKTNYLKEKRVCLSFNQWFVDEDYRIKIADSLDLKYSDFALDYAGSPSSFDGRQYKHGKAREMKVFDRWKILKDNSNYREHVNYHPEARELSYEIFGKEERMPW